MATAMARWQDFETELKAREASIVAMLPQHVTKARFVNSAIAAVKQTPDLLLATPRSLFTAITKSAQDGLLPDGREGVITVYKEKQKDGSWLQVASWNPMTYGLRKRARELDGLIVNAQIVYEHDRFVRLEGDDPRLEHEPAPLGTTRGAMIGAYAIIRSATHILHREVMDAEQIDAVRRQSKLPDGLMWKTFTTEAWRKTVIRRALKTVPCSETLEHIVRRDEDQFAFVDEPAARPRVVQGGRKPLPPIVGAPLTPAENTALDLELAAKDEQASDAV